MRIIMGRLLILLLLFAPTLAHGEQFSLWKAAAPQAHLIPPRISGPMSAIVDVTINGYLAESYGWSLPSKASVDTPGAYILVGNETNNGAIKTLVDGGLALDRADLGDEGFRILTHEAGDHRFVILTANTPVGLKHACQELVYFRTAADTKGGQVDWPLDVHMKPQFDYRGCYILPCWSAYDSHPSWVRVLKFLSEIDVNRPWFWLAGFPLLKQYGGQYENTDLASAYNVNGLVNLCNAEGMKFYIGGGWYTWHHEKIAAGSIERGVQYYRDMLALLPGTYGLYLEPAGEGSEVSEEVWRKRTEAFRGLAESIWRDRPEFEFAVAIGEFNHEAYRKMMHEIDAKRIYWWWCWGDPVRDNALAQHPLMLRWHTNLQMSNYHGSTAPPEPREAELTGLATSYDPGQGYGNPWNGWGKLGVDHRRDFDPYDMPYFSTEYLFRERCWDLKISDEAFARRMQRRLFDADMPADAAERYLALAALCPQPEKANDADITAITAFVDQHLEHGTRRNRDTLKRMRFALDGIRTHKAKAATRPQ